MDIALIDRSALEAMRENFERYHAQAMYPRRNWDDQRGWYSAMRTEDGYCQSNLDWDWKIWLGAVASVRQCDWAKASEVAGDANGTSVLSGICMDAIRVLRLMAKPHDLDDLPGVLFKELAELRYGRQAVEKLLKAGLVQNGGYPAKIPSEVRHRYGENIKRHEDRRKEAQRDHGYDIYPFREGNLLITEQGWKIAAVIIEVDEFPDQRTSSDANPVVHARDAEIIREIAGDTAEMLQSAPLKPGRIEAVIGAAVHAALRREREYWVASAN